jgi:glycosyltransferase involved in cell wall biosynthesis
VSAPPRVGFVLEQALGHVAHADTLVRLVTPDERIQAEFAPIDFSLDPRWARVPGHGNWTVRAGLRARRAIRDLERDRRLDALFVHTQVAAMLMPDVLRRIPCVVSLDATPLQYDELGAHYGHSIHGTRVERLKRQLHRSCFARADRLVAWSAWAKNSLITDYEVLPEKVAIIPPGVDFARWGGRRRPDHADDSPVRILFVGADLTRKGGHTLVDAVRRLRATGAEVELDLVTREQFPPEPGVTVHRDLEPNSPTLIELYWAAHIFCLPTFGDTLGIVLCEAGAAGLALVSTDVGAISEIVRPEHTGLLVPPGDELALTAALSKLIAEPSLRASLGAGAQRLVRAEFNATSNASRLVELLVDVASGC